MSQDRKIAEEIRANKLQEEQNKQNNPKIINMKTLSILICALIMGGCATTSDEGIDYLGQQPWYAINAPHAKACPCCLGKKELTPAPTSAILKVQQSKKDNMSIAKNARCSQIMQDVERGKYVSNSKFRGYGEPF